MPRINELSQADQVTDDDLMPFYQDGNKATRAAPMSLVKAYILAIFAGIGGSALIGWIQSGIGAIARTVQDKLCERVSLEDFGGGVGVADNYAAALAAYNAVSSGAVIRCGAGVYNFATPPVFGAKRVSWVGEGANQTIWNYTGANTSTDCFTWGDGITEVNRLRIKGIGFESSTVMTAGAGVRFKLLTRSEMTDVSFGHQDGNSNFYHGLWIDGCDFATIDSFQVRAQQDGVRVNGAPGSATVGARADLFLTNGKIGKCNVGLHVGGAFGGLYVDATDIIGNVTNILIDKTINTFGNNRESIFGPFCALDSAGSAVSPFSGINLDIQDSSGFVFFASPWIASAATLIRTGSAFTGLLKLDGGFLFNAFNTTGGSGHGIEIGNASAQVHINGTRFKTINGTAVICTAGTAAGSVDLINPVFESDVTTKTSNVNPLPVAVHRRFIAGGPSTFACAVDGTPSQTFYQAASGGAAMAVGYFGANASGGWMEFAKSRSATLGAHAIVQANDIVGGINFSASDGTVFQSIAQIKVTVPTTPSAGDVAGRVTFYSRPSGGALTSRIWLLENGNFTPVTDNAINLGQAGNKWLNVYSQNVVMQPPASVTPANNGDVTFQLTSNTQLTIKVKGSDGVVRSTNLTLA
jgi:hypothetical protein